MYVPDREWIPLLGSFNTNQKADDDKAACKVSFDGMQDADSLTAEAAKELGNEEFKKGGSRGYELAKRYYTKSLLLDPMQHAVYSNRSFANLKLSLPHFAAADAVSCVRLCPSFVKGHLRLADAYLAMGSIRDAVICLQQAIECGCAHNEEDKDFLQRKMADVMSPASGMKIMATKESMGFDDPSLIHESIYGVRNSPRFRWFFWAQGDLRKTLEKTRDKTQASHPRSLGL